jgi:hypothetical protein
LVFSSRSQLICISLGSPGLAGDEHQMRKSQKSDRRIAALKAWKTMRGPVWKAQRSERLSKAALDAWAVKHGFKVVFLDAATGHPRTGIADALLIRVRPKAADQIELYVVPLKGGGSGFEAREMARLEAAAAAVKAVPLIVLHDGERLHFLGGEPSFTSHASSRARRKSQ